MMLQYHDGQRSHIALTITPVTRHLTLNFLLHSSFDVYQRISGQVANMTSKLYSQSIFEECCRRWCG